MSQGGERIMNKGQPIGGFEKSIEKGGKENQE